MSAAYTDYLPNYDILEYCTESPRGMLFLAKQVSTGEGVFVFFLHPKLTALFAYQTLYEQLRLAESVRHPHILRLLDFGSFQQLVYYVIEYVPGDRLAVRIAQQQDLPEDDALSLVEWIGHALGWAWRRHGLFHGALTADELFITTQGDLKLGCLLPWLSQTLPFRPVRPADFRMDITAMGQLLRTCIPNPTPPMTALIEKMSRPALDSPYRDWRRVLRDARAVRAGKILDPNQPKARHLVQPRPHADAFQITAAIVKALLFVFILVLPAIVARWRWRPFYSAPSTLVTRGDTMAVRTNSPVAHPPLPPVYLLRPFEAAISTSRANDAADNVPAPQPPDEQDYVRSPFTPDPTLDRDLTPLETIESAHKNKTSGFQVLIKGQVIELLADDLVGSKHQRMLVKLENGLILEIAHNIDLAPRLPQNVLQQIVYVYGEYAWDPKGDVVHFTHIDPSGRHKDGWIDFDGVMYNQLSGRTNSNSVVSKQDIRSLIARRPRPVDFNFEACSNEAAAYLAGVPPAFRTLETKRFSTVREVLPHIVKLMHYFQFENGGRGVLLKNNRRIEGTVRACNPMGVLVENTTVSWAEISIEQMAEFLEYFGSKRLGYDGTMGLPAGQTKGPLQRIDVKKDAAGESFLAAALCDWYGWNELAIEMIDLTHRLDPEIDVDAILPTIFGNGFASYTNTATADKSTRAKTTFAGETLYPCLGQIYSHGMLTAAYAKVINRYVVDPDSHECIPAWSLRPAAAVPLQGTVQSAAGRYRLWLQSSDGTQVVVLRFRRGLPKANDRVFCMVMPGLATLSVRDKDRKIRSMSQYMDVTMTFSEFVAFLRNGFHFPEAPELATRAGRRRLFSTARTQGSKVAEILLQRGGKPTAPPMIEAPTNDSRYNAQSVDR